MNDIFSVSKIRFGKQRTDSASAKFLTNKIKLAAKQKFTKYLTQQKSAIETKLSTYLQNYLIALIKTSSEFQLIIKNHQIVGELGLSPSKIANFVGNFANDIVKRSKVKIRISTGSTKRLAAFRFHIVDVRYSDLLNKSYASYISHGKDGKITNVNWLEWLLYYGSEIAVSGFHAEEFSPSTPSRSGFGYLMVEDTNINDGWQVPTQLQGTPNDNFITRILLASHGEYGNNLRAIKRMMMFFLQQDLFKI